MREYDKEVEKVQPPAATVQQAKVNTSKPLTEGSFYTGTGRAEVSSVYNSAHMVQNSTNVKRTDPPPRGTFSECLDKPQERAATPTSTEVGSQVFPVSKNQQSAPTVQTGFQSTSGKSTVVSERAKLNIPDNSLSNDAKHGEIPKTVGFQTAAGANIEISDTAKQKAHLLMANIENESATSVSGIEKTRGFTSKSGENVSSPETTKRKATDQVIDSQRDEDQIPKLIGFTSAGGKKIKVSEEARKKANILFAGIENEPPPSTNEVPMSVGFSSASGKKISVSDEAKEKANKLLAEVRKEEKPEHSDISQNVGFTSASGKKINISEEATRKANKLLAGMDSDNSDSGGFIGFQSASGKVINISAEAQVKARNLMADVGTEVTLKAISPVKTINKPVEKDYSNVPKGFRPFKAPKMAAVVKKEMLQAKRSLREEVGDQRSRVQTENGQSRKIDSIKNEGVHRKSSSDCNQLSEMDGFTFTQLAEVTNSTAAFLETDEDLAWTQMPSKSSAEMKCEFPDEKPPTADSRKALKLEDKPGENILGNTEPNRNQFKLEDRPIESGTRHEFSQGPVLDSNGITLASVGFNTASGKPIHMTEESMQKAQNLIASIGDEGKQNSGNHTVCGGFRTADGQEIQISDSSIQKAHALMDRIKNDFTESTDTDCETKEHKKEDVLETCDGVDNESVWEDLELNDSLIKLTDETTTSNSTTPVHENIAEINNDVVEQVSADYQEILGMEIEPETVNEDENMDKVCMEKRFDNSSVHSQEFVTASGYAIPVLDESMERAKELLADIQEDPDPDKEQSKPIELTPKCLKQNEQESEKSGPSAMECKENLEHPPVVPRFLGFQTASGNKVEISEEVLKEVKQKYLGDEYASPMSDDCHVPSSQDKDSKRGGSVVNSKDVQNEGQVLGFQTASGHNVEIKEESLVEIKKRFEFDEKSPEKFIGFQTARGNQIDVNADSLAKVKNMFDAGERSPQKGQFIGFQTASGSKVSVSETSLQRAQPLLRENLPSASDHGASGDAKPFMGFSTASGSKVEISESALKKARMFFDGPTENQIVPASSGPPQNTVQGSVPEYGSPARVPVIGFQTASGNEVKISEDALQRVKNNFECYSKNTDESHETPNQSMPFVGFQMASGGKVNISEDSLKRAKSLFDDECTKTENSIESKNSFGFQTANGNKVSVSESSLEQVKSHFDSPNSAQENKHKNPTLSGFSGFQTAGGNQVNISEGALKRVKGLFENESEVKQDTKPKTSFIGFQTASGAKVSVSENSLKQVQSLLSTEPAGKPHPDRIQSSGFIGFQTASGGKVEISDAALQQAKGILSVEEEVPLNTKEPFGFQTASGTNVCISDAALKEAGVVLRQPDVKNTMHIEDRRSDHPPKHSAKRLNFMGFETAAEGKVNVSDRALKEIQGMGNLDDCARAAKSSVPKAVFGFQTASGSKAEVSESALQHVQSTLGDTLEGHTETWSKPSLMQSREGNARCERPDGNPKVNVTPGKFLI